MRKNITDLRYSLLMKKLSQANYFKLDYINSKYLKQEDIDYITFIYAIAGCSAFTIDVNPSIVKELIKVIRAAKAKANQLKVINYFDPFITISFDNQTPKNILFELIERSLLEGAEIIQFNPIKSNKESIVESINNIELEFPGNVISLILNRKFLSNSNIIEIIKKSTKLIGDRLIIEINTYQDDLDLEKHNNILETLSSVDIINKRLKERHKSFQSPPVIISSKNDQKIYQVANQCEVSYNGISVNYDSLVNTHKETQNFNRINQLTLTKDLNNASNTIKNILL